MDNYDSVRQSIVCSLEMLRDRPLREEVRTNALPLSLSQVLSSVSYLSCFILHFPHPSFISFILSSSFILSFFFFFSFHSFLLPFFILPFFLCDIFTPNLTPFLFFLPSIYSCIHESSPSPSHFNSTDASSTLPAFLTILHLELFDHHFLSLYFLSFYFSLSHSSLPFFLFFSLTLLTFSVTPFTLPFTFCFQPSIIYHLDVGAMYPNIILTNRLQPSAIVSQQGTYVHTHVFVHVLLLIFGSLILSLVLTLHLPLFPSYLSSLPIYLPNSFPQSPTTIPPLPPALLPSL